MKSLNMYLGSVIDNDDLHFESLLADDDIFLDPEKDKKVVEEWIKNNYIIAGRLTVKNDFVVDCSGDVFVKNRNIESLANDMFRWGKVKTYFYCQHCDNLKSLEGAPKEVGRNFSCSNCENLKTLDGAPKKVGEKFFCRNCDNLKITDSDRKKYKIVQ